VPRRQSYEQRLDATVACNQNSVSVKLQQPNELHTNDCQCVARGSLLAPLSKVKKVRRTVVHLLGKGKGQAVRLHAMKTYWEVELVPLILKFDNQTQVTGHSHSLSIEETDKTIVPGGSREIPGTVQPTHQSLHQLSCYSPGIFLRDLLHREYMYSVYKGKLQNCSCNQFQ
jgi:hypothetical protein